MNDKLTVRADWFGTHAPGPVCDRFEPHSHMADGSITVPALAQPSEPGLDEERLARALCIDAESIESDPVDFDVCPDREGHIEYAKALLAIAAALRQEVGNG